MKRWPLLFIASAVAATAVHSQEASAPAASAEPSGWKITRTTSPISDATTLAATIQSSNEISNTLGYPARAALTIRCAEGSLAVYVSWTQVVNQFGTNMMGDPKTMAVWRIDSGKLIANLWDIDTTGTAAGEFKQRNATKLLGTLVGAKKLAVRLTGRQTQDAAFDVEGIDQVATDAAAACKVKLR